MPWSRKGDRKPRGYDKGALNNGFGQEDCLRVVDRRAVQAVVDEAADHAIADEAADMGCEP